MYGFKAIAKIFAHDFNNSINKIKIESRKLLAIFTHEKYKDNIKKVEM